MQYVSVPDRSCLRYGIDFEGKQGQRDQIDGRRSDHGRCACTDPPICIVLDLCRGWFQRCHGFVSHRCHGWNSELQALASKPGLDQDRNEGNINSEHRQNRKTQSRVEHMRFFADKYNIASKRFVVYTAMSSNDSLFDRAMT